MDVAQVTNLVQCIKELKKKIRSEYLDRARKRIETSRVEAIQEKERVEQLIEMENKK